jgi:hypothetical protein
MAKIDMREDESDAWVGVYHAMEFVRRLHEQS